MIINNKLKLPKFYLHLENVKQLTNSLHSLYTPWCIAHQMSSKRLAEQWNKLYLSGGNVLCYDYKRYRISMKNQARGLL